MSDFKSPFWMSTSTVPNFSLMSAFTVSPSFARSSTLAWVSGRTSILRLPENSTVAVEATDVQISDPRLSFMLRSAATQSLSVGRLTSTVPLKATRVASSSSRFGGSCGGAARTVAAVTTRKASVFMALLELRVHIALFSVDGHVGDHVEEFPTGHVLLGHAADDEPALLAFAQCVAPVDAEKPHREPAP